MAFSIRPYREDDLAALYHICLLTGDNGVDASALFEDGDLLGHFYAAPYGIFEPAVCFVLTLDEAVVGYMVGCRDSAEFKAKLAEQWFPALRERYPFPAVSDCSADATIIRYIHAEFDLNPDAIDYPAHLHIDLLPVAQRQGQGRKLMQAFLNNLRELGVPGVHLEVAARNKGAICFYERLGFKRIKTYSQAVLFGMVLGNEK